MEEICRELADLLRHDPGHRRIPSLSSAAALLAAAALLSGARKTMIISGFYIGRAGAWETDGPLGALVLADALEQSGAEVVLLTDAGCLPIFESGHRLLGLGAQLIGLPPGVEPDAAELLAAHRPDLLLAIERSGRAADGRYYNASGFDISQHVAHLDNLFLAARAQGVPTLAVGDGGNELGFGARVNEAKALLGSAGDIACVTAADHLVPCGVSNWGAYALAALVVRQRGSGSSCDESALVELLQSLVAAGAIDGVDLRSAATVDGLPLEEEISMFARLMAAGRGKLSD